MYFTPVRGLEWDSGDPAVSDLNVKSLSDKIVQNIKERESYSLTNHVLFPWGFDFQVQRRIFLFFIVRSFICAALLRKH